jgi:hypothetical protein
MSRDVSKLNGRLTHSLKKRDRGIEKKGFTEQFTSEHGTSTWEQEEADTLGHEEGGHGDAGSKVQATGTRYALPN